MALKQLLQNFNKLFMMKSLFIPALIFSAILVSCNGGTESQPDKELTELVDSTAAKADSVLLEEDSDVSYNLPSALQIAYVFKKSGTAYNASLPNDINNTSKYDVSDYKRATNFGVYSADLAYSLFNKKTQESKNYLKACKEVGSYLGLNSAYEGDDAPQRFEKNLSNEDSLIKIVSGIQLKTDLMFEQNKQKHITVLAFVGAWSESMYIANEAYAKGREKKVMNSLLEQLSLSDVVTKALKRYQSAEVEIPKLIAEVERIKTTYENISAVKTSIEKDEELDFEKVTVADAEVKSISDLVKGLRKAIVD